jgi:hypothetical protein
MVLLKNTSIPVSIPMTALRSKVCAKIAPAAFLYLLVVLPWAHQFRPFYRLRLFLS